MKRRKIYRKKSYLNKILSDGRVLIVFVIITMIALARLFIPIFSRKHEIEKRKQAVESEIKVLKSNITKLSDELEKLEKDKVYIEQIAREQLGLAKEGEVVYNIVEPTTSSKS